MLTLSLLFGPPTFASAIKNGMLAFSPRAPSLKRLNVHGRNEHPTRRPKLQSAEHNPAVNEVTAKRARISCECEQRSSTKKLGHVEILEQPAFGQVRIANELRKRGLTFSPETMTKRLKALEARSA